jgi:predicted transglutaminase-like cysteine proteinase
MSKRVRHVAAALALVATTTLTVTCAIGASDQRYNDQHYNDQRYSDQRYIDVVSETRAPIGWVEFCAANARECAATPSPPRDIVLTTTAYDDLVSINRYVNSIVKPMTDIEHWGTIEKWSYPDDGYGDCEDYALLKRRLLLRAGWPREALLLTVVRDRKDEGHAVLTVKTDRGEFILDNQVDEILAWYETGYRFMKRQSQGNPNVWVSLHDSRSAPATTVAKRQMPGVQPHAIDHGVASPTAGGG